MESLGNKGVTTRRIKKSIYTVSDIELSGTYSTIVTQQSYI